MVRRAAAGQPVGMGFATWTLLGLAGGGLSATLIGTSTLGAGVLGVAGAVLALAIRSALIGSAGSAP